MDRFEILKKLRVHIRLARQRKVDASWIVLFRLISSFNFFFQFNYLRPFALPGD